MKRLLSIGLLLLSLLVACTPKGDDGFVATRHGTSLPTTSSPELAAVDSLLWRQPDSALALLQDYLDCRDAAYNVSNANDTIIEDVARYVSTTAYDRHYANLLLAELLYKNDYAQTNRAELLQAVGYFDSLVREAPPLKRGLGGLKTTQSPSQPDIIAFLSARAHYINGVGYYEHDSVVPACKEYLKALEVMEEHFLENDLAGHKAQFMAMTYTRLTVLFSDQYLHNQAIYFGKESLHYYYEYNASPKHIAWMLTTIGSRYDILGNNDSAFLYYNRVLNILSDTISLTYRDAATHLAYLSYKSGEPTVKSLSQLNVLMNEASSDKEYFSRCLTIGEILYNEELYDSAYFYLNKVFEFTHSTESKKLAAERLVEIFKKQNKELDAMKYVDFLVPFANLEENQSAIKSQLTEQYKNYGQRRQDRVHQHDKKKSQRQTMMVIVCLLVLITSVSVLYIKNKKRKHKLETQIEVNRYAYEIQQKALSGKLKKSKEALAEALKQLEGATDKMTSQHVSRPNKDYTSFLGSPICRHILETVHQQKFKSKIDCIIYKEYALQKEQLLALRLASDENMDDYTIRLKKHYPNLTDEDVTYCCLYLLDISDADIAALMQKAYPTVCERRRKIKRIVGENGRLNNILRNVQ